MRRKKVPLIIEDYPDDYTGYPFITLVMYKKVGYLMIVDNTDDKKVMGYVLDLCGPEQVDEVSLIAIVESWWDKGRERYPISIEFSRLEVTASVNRIYRTFAKDYITRIIGYVPFYDMSYNEKIHKTKRKLIRSTKHKTTNIIKIS